MIIFNILDCLVIVYQRKMDNILLYYTDINRCYHKLIIEYVGKSLLFLDVDNRDCSVCMKEYIQENKKDNTPLRILLLNDYNNMSISKKINIRYSDKNTGQDIKDTWRHHYVSYNVKTHTINDPKLNIYDVDVKDYIFIFTILIDVPMDIPLENDVILEVGKTHFKYRHNSIIDVCRVLMKNTFRKNYTYERQIIFKFPELFY